MPDQNVSKISYQLGQSLTCTVDAEEPGGYQVMLPDEQLAFLPSESVLEVGERVEAIFIAMQGERILLSLSPHERAKERPKRLSVRSDPASGFDELLSEVKKRKEQAVRNLLIKLQDEDLDNTIADVVEAVKQVLDPLDTGKVDASGKQFVEEQIDILVQRYSEPEVTKALIRRFSAIRDQKRAPEDSPIDKAIAKWFW
jgi:hypothetical protein